MSCGGAIAKENYINLSPSIASDLSLWSQKATSLLNRQLPPALQQLAPTFQQYATAPSRIAPPPPSAVVVPEKIKWYTWMIVAIVLALLIAIVAIVTIRKARAAS